MRFSISLIARFLLPAPAFAFLYSALSPQCQITAQRFSLILLKQLPDLLNFCSRIHFSRPPDSFSTLHCREKSTHCRYSVLAQALKSQNSVSQPLLRVPEFSLFANMMSVTDFFYGAREPVWIVHTPQSAMKSYVAGTPPYISATPQTPQTVNTRGHRNNHAEVIQHTTVELKVPLCCEACEERVKHALLNCNGVESVRCDTFKQRVTVTGTAAPADLLKICKKLHKRSELLSGNPGTGRRVKNTPASVASAGGWSWNSGWSSKNTPAAISAWQ